MYHVFAMAEEFFDFVWEVYEGEYQWVRSRCTTEAESKALRKVSLDERVISKAGRGKSPAWDWFLTTGLRIGAAGLGSRRYAPLQEDKSLCRNFATTSCTKKGIVTFADQYGLLGGAATQHIALPDIEKAADTGVGELLTTWQREMAAMRESIVLWDMISQGDADGLRKHMRTITRLFHKKILERFKPGDLIQPAVYYLQHIVNERLKDCVRAKLLWNPERKVRLYLVPDSLLAAMWVQFAQSISEERQHRACRQCGTWFEVFPPLTRKSRGFCSGTCRSAAYRDRQEQAWRLHQEGNTLKAIAKELHCQVRTVRGWLAKKVRRSRNHGHGSVEFH